MIKKVLYNNSLIITTSFQMVKEDIVEKEVVAVTGDLKYLIADKILKIKQDNIRGKIVKNYLTCQLSYRLYKVHL